MVGKEGTAHTILRPSGKVKIEDNIYDAFTRGSYIENGDKVRVIGEEGNALLVKKI